MKNIIKKRIEDIINDNYLSYGKYIIINRAIPSLEDGMKPVYRRILYALNKNNCNSFTKSATCTGYVFPFHPHGSTYGTMVGLAQEDAHLTRLLEGKGNFGQHTSRDLAPAADRYSEIKLSELSKDIFKTLNKDIVKWIPNYDGTQEIPEFLPVKFPMILHMCQEGIALGMSNRMPSFSINDICLSMIEYLDNGNKTILIPDFPTGANIIYDEEVFNRINYEGKGTLRVRAKADINGQNIMIKEIPYSTTRESIIESIIDLVQKGKIQGIKNVYDATGLNSFGIGIECKKGINPELILEQLYKSTTLEDAYSCNMNVLCDGLPRIMGVWDIIDKWLEWRHSCLISWKEGENKLLKDKLEVYSGLIKIIDRIDELIGIIRFTNDNILVNKVISNFNLTENQAEYLVNMKIRNINKDYIEKRIESISELESEIENNNIFINSKEVRNNFIKEDLVYISKKFGCDRKSKVITIDNSKMEKILNEIALEEKPNKDVKVIITNENYIKKIDMNDNKENKLKAGDSIKYVFETRDSEEILVFSGTDCYKIYVDNLKLSKSTELGEYIPNIINCKSITGYSIIGDKYKSHVICYSNDKIVRISTKSFKTNTRRRKLSNSLSNIADVLSIIPLKEDIDIKIINNKGKEKIINTSSIAIKTSRCAMGACYLRNIKKIEIK